jgi:hypothetical protein
MRAINSTVTVRDCVATGSRSGMGAGQTGAVRLVNCAWQALANHVS